MKAWRVTWKGLPNETGIIAAEKRSQASASVARQIEEECGYKEVWGRIRCTRAPEYDAWAKAQPPARIRRSILEEYVKAEAAAASSAASSD